VADRALASRLRGAMRAGLGVNRGDKVAPGKGTTRAAATGLVDQLDKLGIHTVHFGSTDEDLVEYTDKLWDDQNDPIAERQKEWLQIEHYVANEQYLAYHRGRRDWIVRDRCRGGSARRTTSRASASSSACSA
jgi:hypothetical protein